MFGDNIFEELYRMQRQMDKLFGQSYGKALGYDDKHPAIRGEMSRHPRCDVCETENSLIAVFELPGVDKKDIELNVTDDQIEVRVEKKQEEKHDKNYHASSYSFYRNVPLTKSVDSDMAKATYKDGLLRVEMPKNTSKKEKRVQIE